VAAVENDEDILINFSKENQHFGEEFSGWLDHSGNGEGKLIRHGQL
jgi:hypothetical protein